jgi:hypothetical protein
MEDAALWVALGAAALALAAVVAAALLWVALRRLRAAQRVLLPDGTPAGVVDRQASLQREMAALQEGLRDMGDLAARQGAVTEQGLRTALRFQGLVRYDAYSDMGGRQSWSLALLDGTGTGAVMTSLHARDHARVYLKELVEGEATQRLSPEEEEAVAIALGGPQRPSLNGAVEEQAPASPGR